ncbi:Pimeloyl-ACP methyl ester carboxylesterase [Georgenia satyanarayanai]|uniref:Pimeloyl-ACP methyl ester carboxylesterase n=1 Tax=Georgenia satyanarayanai TaxID=860221 RepID=A0A2Y9C4S1_9MICO|nr:alpha/beta hydrolase [Georgenia satyanarayanai]PYG00684.1 pimeloyl-ACP methyl ester carboxylesterase [Georgenia satyanarayanai]SSA40073.1 Pimeloyl-ACP methyl ester carboxylesterase [Georgenia satyanarayanai]
MTAAVTVLLVHGIRASRTMWRPQLAALEEAGVAALAPDLPGHGERAGETFTLDGARAAVEEAARSAGGAVVVVGLSLGGYLTLHWAARTEQRVVGVLAAGCSTRPRGPGLAAYRRVAALIARLPDGGRRLNDTLARVALPPAALADLHEGGMELGVMDAALAAVGGLDPIADLRAIDAPVRLVNGRWDHFRTEERRFLAACRDGRLDIVPGATHLVSLVRPAEFNRIVLDLVEEVAPGSVRTARSA